mmetsp:Transcript_2828/g.8635  ORF Transcript_2828/g.8635 Transcript_2828/m.8635 type:complete len:282 (-) Transcript_2828:1285-2130(-)|eukprot:CAMPEP_0198724130 /NCGR_PEP_ID=MMETSP1475-20131203/1634_1 /TAXON_ID= ORGANISM="Unidentified sp., Strain CCMP1999" /NCGR_SAMPLE_ID=MMETSP1475 /ASSEMBLY_ACC=CAM_ASM_001111 /LENGTH=281 /DNA_ID=CAMNT_0044485555 /DNA_START=55 /DNA_END=900 /DNA_ORIENTATION=+
MKISFMLDKQRRQVEVDSASTMVDLRKQVAEVFRLEDDDFVMISAGKQLEPTGKVPDKLRAVMIIRGSGSHSKPASRRADNDRNKSLHELLDRKAAGTEQAPSRNDELAEEKAPEEFHVVAATGKSKQYIVCSPSTSFSTLRSSIAERLNTSPSSLQLLLKGRKRDDSETLASAGVNTSGCKLMVLFTESYYERQQKSSDVDRLQGELEEATTKMAILLRKKSKQSLGHESLLVHVRQLEEQYDRLKDNFMHVDETAVAPVKDRIEKLMNQFRSQLDMLKL